MAFGLNKEIDRRAQELIAIADREGHSTLRIGGGWRSEARAYSEFFRRYTYYGTTRPPRPFLPKPLYRDAWRAFETAKYFPGDNLHPAGWYTLNWGEIGVATPGNSWHTTCPPDAIDGDTGAVAIDWVNDIPWMNDNCHRVGLRSFQHIPGEAHHTQPVEYPGSRRDYDPAEHQLTIWQFDQPLEDDDMQRYRAIDNVNGKEIVDPAVIEVVGRDAQWLNDGHANDAFNKAGMPPTPIGRAAYGRFYFDGPEPEYTGIFANWPDDQRTKASDFRPREVAA